MTVTLHRGRKSLTLKMEAEGDADYDLLKTVAIGMLHNPSLTPLLQALKDAGYTSTLTRDSRNIRVWTCKRADALTPAEALATEEL